MTGDEWKGEDESTRYWLTMDRAGGGTVVIDSLAVLAMEEESKLQTAIYIEGGAKFTVDMSLVDVLRMMEATAEDE